MDFTDYQRAKENARRRFGQKVMLVCVLSPETLEMVRVGAENEDLPRYDYDLGFPRPISPICVDGIMFRLKRGAVGLTFSPLDDDGPPIGDL